MVWLLLKILWHAEDSSAGDSERIKMERKTEDERKDNIKKWTTMWFADALRAAVDS